MTGIGSGLGGAFNILYIDLPGFGRTISTGSGYDMETLADSLKMILDELHLEKVVILGYSMGGRVALAFTIMHPRHVRTLILESASAGLKTASERIQRAAVDEERARKIISDYQAFLDEWEGMGLFQTQKTLSEESSSRQRKMRESQQPEEVADSLRKYGTGVQPSYWDKLPQLDMPVLLIAGGRDRKFVSINREMAERIPHATLEIVEGAGHNIHLESREKFGTIISEFLT
ncbi:2-succinyl-6-hydroxy-2,4-cyclohexadiene-1-carboxylate synthase [Lacicoccus alkaliphilus DSM 16010]|uniref:Putative 2-succinyl-6-hydroxy-2,4-cyclohexadiene-1-carboxylate synthase n=2 Tax=Lacicoccus TaxID=3076172 RepID=A0A1M7ADH1_9BACL|nr:2-succinyl-6-hydroxy-2,4-cyclohexadiene-1-carboxylate synthase [Salinicoccus alkaliphilus DSM 16010]